MQRVDRFQDLADRQAELRPKAARTLPPSRTAGRQLDAHPDLWPHTDLLRILQDHLQFGILLDHRNHAPPNFLCEHRHLDKLGIFEAVTDNGRIRVGQRHDSQQFRLAARFQAKTELAPVLDDFLDNLYGNEPDQWSGRLTGWDRLRFIVNALTRMRMIDHEGRIDFTHTGPPTKGSKGLVPWFAVPGAKWHGTRIVFGHWSALGLIVKQRRNL